MIAYAGVGKGSIEAVWSGPVDSIAYDEEGVVAKIRALALPCYVVRTDRGVGVTNDGHVMSPAPDGVEVLLVAPPVSRRSLGDPDFVATYGLDCAYMAGSMANAISSEAMVIALGRAGMLGSFGAGGLSLSRLESAIWRIQDALPDGPYAFNLIHSPHEPALEGGTVELYLKHAVRVVEASAYLALTPHIVRYRVAGLDTDQGGHLVIRNRIIAKVSRREVAAQFFDPAPTKLLGALVQQGLVTDRQAALAANVPMADDVTVEADSGGHTDNRPLVCLLPSVIAQRDDVQALHQYATPVRIGAAGGIGTPIAAFGALMMGAAYVVTGSINHACVEAGTSEHVKTLLAQAGMADVMMAPAADMFEMGVNLQVLRRGTFFPLRARKLYDLYQAYDSLDAIPAAERRKLEQQVFQRSVDEVWDACVAFFSERDPVQIERALDNPKRRMALVFRWYLGLATRWAVSGESGRELDYQIWCGPAMGAFNDWARGTPLEALPQRQVAEVGRQIMDGASLLYRLQVLKMGGLHLPTLVNKGGSIL